MHGKRCDGTAEAGQLLLPAHWPHSGLQQLQELCSDVVQGNEVETVLSHPTLPAPHSQRGCSCRPHHEHLPTEATTADEAPAFLLLAPPAASHLTGTGLGATGS